jgi:hypothetical protein
MVSVSRVTATVAALLLSGTAAAVLPAPAPPGYSASWKAIDHLDPIVGSWTGEEIQHVVDRGIRADFPRRRYLTIERPQGRDLLLIEGGSNNSPPHAEFTDVITFDASAPGYVIYLPGYRLFSGSSKTSERVPLAQGRDGRFTWIVDRDDGGRTRTTVWLEDGKLHQTREIISADGVARTDADMVLEKTPR